MSELIEFLRRKENIYIYGAGIVGRRCANFLKNSDICYRGFIVSKLDQSVERIEEIKPVYIWNQEILSTALLEEWVIILAVSPLNYTASADIKDRLFSSCLKNVIILSKSMTDELRNFEVKQAYQSYVNSKGFCLKPQQQFREKNMSFYYRVNSGPLFRVININHKTVKEVFSKFCNLQVFEKLYGPLRIIPHGSKLFLEKSIVENESIAIYRAFSHFDGNHWGEFIEDSSIPIQVGAKLTLQRKKHISDDMGENISVKNPNYCECTALYWIWKNTIGQQYVGFQHYRRRLVLDQNSIDSIKKYKPGVVLALPQFVTITVKGFFTGLIPEYDWILMRNALMDYDPYYGSIISQYENSHFYFSCNLCLFQRKWFDRYCEFAFSIAEVIEKEYTKRNIYRQDRYMGYIFENLLSLFVMRYYDELNVYCTEVEWIE